jgi:hypothetical protein
MTVRFSLFALALTLSASASAAPTQDGGSSLDRLSSTENVGSSGEMLAASPASGSGGTADAVPPPPPPDAPPVPIDGGLSLLALAGAGYAAKRLRARRA